MLQEEYPSYFDAEYFEKILQKKFKNSAVKVNNVRFEPCGGVLSYIFRTFVNYHMSSDDGVESFVIKLPAKHELAIKKVGPGSHDVHNKEMNFFEIVAPQLEKILNKVGVENIFTKIVAVDREHEAIIFEDLIPQGFDMTEKSIGFDELQTKITLKKLADFHAASVFVQEKHPKVFDTFKLGMFSRKIDAFNDTHESIFNFVVEEVSTWPGFEKYAEKLQKMKPNLIENLLSCFDVKPEDFCVLNHGDLWTSNIMFKAGDDGVTVDAVMIDFQFCHWASPILDLLHFLYTSLNHDLFEQSKIEAFVQFYYYELKESLMKHDYDVEKVPTLHQFQLKFLEKLFFGFIYTSNVFPIMISDDPDNDFIAHHSNDERATNFKKRMVKNPKFISIMKRMLPVFDEKGILDS